MQNLVLLYSNTCVKVVLLWKMHHTLYKPACHTDVVHWTEQSRPHACDCKLNSYLVSC